MLFQTPTQFAILGLLFFAGWLFGLASHPGGKKWRRAYDDERLGHATYRDEAEAQLKVADRRISDLERENTALQKTNADLRGDLDKARADRPAVIAPAAAGAAVGAVAASAARPALADETPAPAPVEEKRSWFSWGGDDLTVLRGVDADLAKRLKGERVQRYADIASLTDQDEMALERRLQLPAGYIHREQLREQAKLLAAGETAGHATRFGQGLSRKD